MAKMTADQKARARRNAAARGKQAGAYDYLRASRKPMAPAKGRRGR